MPLFLHWQNTEGNGAYHVQLLWELSKFISAKSLDQCLVDNKYYINHKLVDIKGLEQESNEIDHFNSSVMSGQTELSQL